VLSSSSRQVSEAIETLRSGIAQATQALRDLTEASGDLAQRAGGMAKDLPACSERVVSTISHRVEQNPLTSIAVAFALGFIICAALPRR
jgi:ElaB/YqjD/DUF883 family membrane-anchored ribosome-binding protein